MPVVAQSLAKPIDNVYIDVKTQGSLERVERCRLKVESPSAGALSNAFQLRVGGSPIEFNRDTEVSLDDGELTVSIRALRDRSDTDDQFQVELSVSTLDAPEKWSNRIALMLSPPPPDHVDLYLSLGNDPQSAGDFARNVLETQDGIHATIDEQYLRLRGFPTVNRGSAYRLWVVDRSGLERNLRVSLYAIPNPVGNLDQNRGEPLEPGRVIEFPEEELSQTLLLELSPEKLAAMAPLLQTSVESKADKLWGGEYDEFDDSFRRHAIPLVFSKPSAEAGAATQPAADKELPGWPVHDGVLCLIEEVDAEGNVVTDPSRDKVNGEDAPKTWWKWLGVGARFPAGDYVDVETFYEYSTRKIVAKVSADPADLVRLGIKKGVQVTATCRPFGNTNARYADAVEQVRELIAAQPAKEFTWQLAEVPQAGDMHLVEFSIDGYRRNVVYQVRTEPNREENVPGELHDQERVRLTRVTFWDRQGTQLPPTSPSEEFVLSKEVRNEAGDWLPLIYDRMEVDVEVDAPGEFDNLSSANPDQIQVGVWPLDAEADAPPASEVEVRYADRRVFTWMAVGNDGLLNVWSSVADHRVVIDKIGDLQSGKYELRSFLKLDEQIVPDPEGVQRLTVDREPPLPGEIRRAATEGDSNVVAKDQPLTVELAARDRLSDVVDVEFRIDGRDTDSELGAEFDRDRGVKLPLDGVIESDGVWTIVIPGDVLKTLPKGKDYFVVAQVIDAAGNRQTRYKPYRFRVSSMAKLPEAEKPVEFQVQPIVNGNTLARVKPLDNGVSITVGGEPPERSASGSYYFRMKKGKYPVKIQVKFRTATYVTPDDYELDVSGKGPYKVRLEKK